MATDTRRPPPPQREVIGIVGGLGPFAHLDLERCLLEAAVDLLGVEREQDFPEWIVSSVPATPDRTLALSGEAPDPTPWLLRSLRRLADGRGAGDGGVAAAGFAVIACHTAHAFLPALRRACQLPILDVVETAAASLERSDPGACVGLLATTGTLKARVHENAMRERGLRTVSLLDLEDGAALHDELVMRPIYGAPGLKTNGAGFADPAPLLDAASRLVEQGGADVVLVACTELAMWLRGRPTAALPIVDATPLLARAAIRRAYALDAD